STPSHRADAKTADESGDHDAASPNKCQATRNSRPSPPGTPTSTAPNAENWPATPPVTTSKQRPTYRLRARQPLPGSRQPSTASGQPPRSACSPTSTRRPAHQSETPHRDPSAM